MKKSKKKMSRKGFLAFSIFFAAMALIFFFCDSFLFGLFCVALSGVLFYGFKNYNKIINDEQETVPTEELDSITQPSPSLDAFNSALSSYYSADSVKEIIDSCDNLLAVLPSVDDAEIIRIIKKSGKKDGFFYQHDFYGLWQNGQSYTDSLRRSVLRKKFRANAENEYQIALEAIPRVPVEIDASAGKSVKHSLADMPEVNYTNITAKFNPDRLPSFVVIDTETNGIKIQGGRILEVSAIRYEDFQPVAAWSTLVNPGKPIPEEASEINHITDEMVADAPALAQVAGSFLEFVGSSVLVGYNLPFDLKFLYSRGVDLVSQKRRYYDVLELSRKAFKNELDHFRLGDVAEECGIVPSNSHRSLADCYTTGLVFQACIDRIIEG